LAQRAAANPERIGRDRGIGPAGIEAVARSARCKEAETVVIAASAYRNL
jgi:hypothetical protein